MIHFMRRMGSITYRFVRWTEQRNFEAVLDMMSMGLINVEPLISHRFPFLDSPSAYDFLSGMIRLEFVEV